MRSRRKGGLVRRVQRREPLRVSRVILLPADCVRFSAREAPAMQSARFRILAAAALSVFPAAGPRLQAAEEGEFASNMQSRSDLAAVSPPPQRRRLRLRTLARRSRRAWAPRRRVAPHAGVRRVSSGGRRHGGGPPDRSDPPHPRRELRRRRGVRRDGRRECHARAARRPTPSSSAGSRSISRAAFPTRPPSRPSCRSFVGQAQPDDRRASRFGRLRRPVGVLLRRALPEHGVRDERPPLSAGPQRVARVLPGRRPLAQALGRRWRAS